MELREYDESLNKINLHLNNNIVNIVYKITRVPPIILLKEDEFKNNVKIKWNLNNNFFNQHEYYFKKNEIKIITFNNKLNYVINVNYQPFGTMYYHAITEVVPNAIWIIDWIKNNISENLSDNITIFVPDSKFIRQLFEWFNIKNPLNIYDNSKNLTEISDTVVYQNYFKQKYVECGIPSLESLDQIRKIIDKKVIYEKKIGIFIFRREKVRNIINSKELFETIKNKYNEIEWKIFDRETIANTAELFSKAKIIVGAHGAGLVNMVFAPRNITIIEIMPNYESNMCYWHQSQLLNNLHIIIPVDYLSDSKQLYVNCEEIKDKLLDKWLDI
jgi:capsular polysaccharide biosynthesis protein